MNRERNAFKAGLFIVLSFIAAVGVLVLIRGEGAGAVQIRTVTFSLDDDISGLRVGDDVRIGGAKVGTVRDIELASMESTPAVLVKFSLPAKYTLHENAQIAIQASLTGAPNLNIASLGSGQALGESASVAGLPDDKKALVDSFKRLAPRLEAIAKGVETQTLPKVNDTVQKTGEMMTQIRDLVGDSKTDFRGTVKNLNQATGSVRDKLPPLIDKVTSAVDKASKLIERVEGSLTSAQAALKDVEKSAANARDFTAAARSIVVDNRSRLDSIVKGLKATSDNLDQTSVEVRHSPWRLLYKPSADEMANLNLYDSARQFAEGAESMSDAATALRDAMHDPNVDKAQLQKLVEHLDESFKSFHTVENKLWTAVKE